MFFTARHALRFGRVNIRIVEQAHFELPQQHRRDEIVEPLLFQHTLPHEFHEMQVTIRLGQFDVHTRLNRQSA